MYGLPRSTCSLTARCSIADAGRCVHLTICRTFRRMQAERFALPGVMCCLGFRVSLGVLRPRGLPPTPYRDHDLHTGANSEAVRLGNAYVVACETWDSCGISTSCRWHSSPDGGYSYIGGYIGDDYRGN